VRPSTGEIQRLLGRKSQPVIKEDFYRASSFSNNFWRWGKKHNNFPLRLHLQGQTPTST
jgi:hypothetical protein